MMAALVDYHGLVLFRAPHQLVTATLREVFQQHIERLAFVTTIGLGRQLGLQGYQLVQTAYLHLLRDIVGQMLGGIGPWTLGVLEHKCGVVAHLTHQRERQLVVFLRLRVITGEDISRQATVGDNATNGGHTLKIPLAGILAVHQFQNTVRTALYGQVDMLAHVRHFGNDTQRLVAHILRVGSRETDAHLWHFSGHKA